MQWLCLQCNQEDGVVNGMCRRCGPTKTKPQDEEAQKEANVEGAAAAKTSNEEAEAEAAERNAASIAAGENTTVDSRDL